MEKPIIDVLEKGSIVGDILKSSYNNNYDIVLRGGRFEVTIKFDEIIVRNSNGPLYRAINCYARFFMEPNGKLSSFKPFIIALREDYGSYEYDASFTHAHGNPTNYKGWMKICTGEGVINDTALYLVGAFDANRFIAFLAQIKVLLEYTYPGYEQYVDSNIPYIFKDTANRFTKTDMSKVIIETEDVKQTLIGLINSKLKLSSIFNTTFSQKNEFYIELKKLNVNQADHLCKNTLDKYKIPVIFKRWIHKRDWGYSNNEYAQFIVDNNTISECEFIENPVIDSYMQGFKFRGEEIRHRIHSNPKWFHIDELCPHYKKELLAYIKRRLIKILVKKERNELRRKEIVEITD